MTGPTEQPVPSPTSASPQGLVFDVQRFSVHDGPGVRTTVFFKGCPLRCRWCQNPESLRVHAEIAFYADRCRDAGDCYAACPRDAIAAGVERVVRERCDGCGFCEPACPFGALRTVGRTVTLEGLLDEVFRDGPFYRQSGGGVTLSGGEPTFQMEFMSLFARRCQERGLGVGLQTCGAFAWERFAPHVPLFEFIHYDLKLMDPERHRELTGAANRTILDNARRLVAAGAPVLFRMPVVPSHTDTGSNLAAVADFLGDLGVAAIHLLRYHAMGEAKLPRLGAPIPSFRAAGATRGRASLEQAVAFFASRGLEVTT